MDKKKLFISSVPVLALALILPTASNSGTKTTDKIFNKNIAYAAEASEEPSVDSKGNLVGTFTKDKYVFQAMYELISPKLKVEKVTLTPTSVKALVKAGTGNIPASVEKEILDTLAGKAPSGIVYKLYGEDGKTPLKAKDVLASQGNKLPISVVAKEDKGTGVSTPSKGNVEFGGLYQSGAKLGKDDTVNDNPLISKYNLDADNKGKFIKDGKKDNFVSVKTASGEKISDHIGFEANPGLKATGLSKDGKTIFTPKSGETILDYGFVKENDNTNLKVIYEISDSVKLDGSKVKAPTNDSIYDEAPNSEELKKMLDEAFTGLPDNAKLSLVDKEDDGVEEVDGKLYIKPKEGNNIEGEKPTVKMTVKVDIDGVTKEFDIDVPVKKAEIVEVPNVYVDDKGNVVEEGKGEFDKEKTEANAEKLRPNINYAKITFNPEPFGKFVKDKETGKVDTFIFFVPKNTKGVNIKSPHAVGNPGYTLIEWDSKVIKSEKENGK